MARTSLPPGFRFHPTDVELIMYYLKRKVMGKQLLEAISELNIYKFSPWDLPDKSCLKSKDLEWYFFCSRERKYASGARMNRATETGYWKTTGKDRPVIYNSNSVGMVKTLVFHQGNAPRGQRTDWVIYEYRIEDKNLADTGVAQDAYVLCKVFKKNGPGPKNGAQYGAPFKEEEWEDDGEVSIYSLLADGPSPGVVGLPENENSAAAISMVDLGNAPGLSLNEPGPSLVVPSNDEVLLDGQDSSIVPSIVDHGNSSVWSFSETCLSSARNSAHNMILDTPDDDDIVHLLASFSEDGPVLHTENENNMKLGDVDYQRGKEGIPHSDESAPFNGLEDPSNCAGGVNEGGHNILGTRDNGYPVDNMLPEDDMTFLELDDFDAPLNFSAESLVSEQMQTGGLFRPCNYGGNEQMMTDSLCSQYNNTNSDLRQLWYDCNFRGYDPHV